MGELCPIDSSDEDGEEGEERVDDSSSRDSNLMPGLRYSDITLDDQYHLDGCEKEQVRTQRVVLVAIHVLTAVRW